MSEEKDDFKALLEDLLDEARVDLKKSADEVAEYAAARANHLATLVGLPGFEQAVRAERDNVALFAGLALAGQITAAQARVVGAIQGMLFMAAKVLAA